VSDRGHVFVVDGDAASADVLQQLLESAGYAVRRATPDADAVGAITAADPDLVLLDTHLSNVDPFELRDQLRQTRTTAYTPVIFMTAADDPEIRVKGLELGDDLIAKPFDTREVLARVERQVTVSKVRTALRESEAKFRSVMESAIDAIISGDVSGDIRSWNSAATALFGFSAEEAIGRPIELIIPERVREAHRTGMHRVSSGGESHVIGKTVELAAIRKDGTEFPVELSLATWVLDDERYYTGIIRDISERKQAEQKFRSVTESAIDAIISADHTGVIVSWNQAATRILGYTGEEVIGTRLEIIIPERFHEPHREGMRRVTEGGESRVIGSTVELSARRKDGTEIPIELSLSTWTIRDERYYTGIIRDIRERKEAEEALRARTQELKDKNDALQETLDQLNRMQGQLIMQEKLASLGKLSAGMAHELNNPAAAAQRGAAQLQQKLSRLQGIHARMIEMRLGEEQVARVEGLIGLAAERAVKPVEMDGLVRSDREHAVEEWLARHDIDSAWDLSSILVSLGCAPDELESLASDFEGDQLSVVLDWIGGMHAIRILVSEIGVGTGRIAEIVRALKSYTYMDQAPIQSVDVHEGLNNTLIILHNKLKGGVTVRREYAEDLPAIEAYGSELNQVWTNIIDNAVDAMGGRGNLAVRTRSDGSSVVVEIEDDGPGIPEEIRTKIFDPFFTTKGPGQGTGLGLNISRNLVVQKHGGEMTVTSEPGRTCFTVRLPVALNPAE